jgi:hypothetical protein
MTVSTKKLYDQAKAFMHGSFTGMGLITFWQKAWLG